MKLNYKLLAVIALTTSLLVASCSINPKGDTAIVNEATQVDSSTGTEISIDTATSKIGFIGYGVGKEHPGYFKISSGNVTVNGGKIEGGNFVIDTKSLSLSQQETMFQTKLKGHLLSGDFFDAGKFPTAKFEITSVEPFIASETDSSVISGANFKVSGNLTLKEVTKNVSFPAKINVNGNAISAVANFNINRNVWSMKYGNDKSLKNAFISEKVNITFDIKSK